MNNRICSTFVVRMKRATKDKKQTGYFLLVLFLLALQNSVLNLHVHVLSDGSVIQHAHPFSGQPSKDQSHSHMECHSFHVGITQFVDTSSAVVLAPPSQILCTALSTVVIAEWRQLQFGNFNLRGPPIA